jgi:formylglycine-generating enzyme
LDYSVAFGSHRRSDLELVKGQVIDGRYELTGVLGSGAETTVWRARDVSSGRETAVKVFRPIALRNPAALKLFKRDLAVLKDEPHANIVRVFDFGEIGVAFYVAMELVHGESLHRAAGATQWPEHAVLEALEQIVSALAWLHSHKVVHGDIRPSNIVSIDGKTKVMDFGPQRDSRQVTLEAPDSYSPYASPERLLGRPMTPASDVYSVAAVMYELLTGDPPNATAGLVERAIGEAPRLSEHAAGVSPELAAIVERCLNPDPALRPATALEIADQCRELRRPDSVLAKREIPGKPLADRIGTTPLASAEVSDLLLGLCHTLDGIHTAGLAHPDLAPKNIYILPDGHPYINSFPTPPPNATLAMTEPKYVAPEILLSSTAAEDTEHPRCDIYVLGFIAYEALAGCDAFRHQLFPDGAQKEGDLFWMKWHADPAARLQAIRDINSSVSEELSALIHRMTEKDPRARVASLKDVENAIQQIQRRFQKTADIELEAPSDSAAESATALHAPKRSPRALSMMLMLIAALSCIPAAWHGLGHGVRFSELPVKARRRFEEEATRTRTWVGELLQKQGRQPSSPALPANIETASGPMVLVAAGRSEVGSSAVANEGPVHTIYLSSFYIDKYEVTNGSYRTFTDSTGYPQPPAPSWDPYYFAKSTHPVLNVSWRDAQTYCANTGKRLPTEAEWEKAARGSSPGSRFWANWRVAGLANLKGAGLAMPAPIGSFPADVSPYGVYDVAGNVHEWVNDRYGLYGGNPILLEPTGGAKVVRGGSYAIAPPELSPSWRASLDPAITPGSDSPVGIRCAADPSIVGDGSRPAINPPRAQSRP